MVLISKTGQDLIKNQTDSQVENRSQHQVADKQQQNKYNDYNDRVTIEEGQKINAIDNFEEKRINELNHRIAEQNNQAQQHFETSQQLKNLNKVKGLDINA